jgi:hypothetical protein
MSGNGYNLTMRGSAVVSNGFIDLTTSVDTTTFLTGSASILNGRTAWTTNHWVWMHQRNAGNLDTIFECGASNDMLHAFGNGTYTFAWENSGSYQATCFDTYTPMTGQWINITVTGASNVINFYKNGGLFGTYSGSSTATVTNPYGCYWGQEADNNVANDGAFDSNQKFQGKYGAIIFYNRALSAAEVMKNYNLMRDKFGAV